MSQELELAIRALRDDVVAPDDNGEATCRRIRDSVKHPVPAQVGGTASIGASVVLVGAVLVASLVHSVRGSEPSVVALPHSAAVNRAAAQAVETSAPVVSSATLIEAPLPPSNELRSQANAGPIASAPQPKRASVRESSRKSAVARASVTYDTPSVDVAPGPVSSTRLSTPVGLARDLYLKAQALHFRGHPAAALAAWDAYLAAVPAGQFTSEARYNRAVVLVRLGRFSEARWVLEAFARGDFGTLRQREAGQLLSQLP